MLYPNPELSFPSKDKLLLTKPERNAIKMYYKINKVKEKELLNDKSTEHFK